MDAGVVREIILNVRSPCVFKNLQIPWECFKLSLEEWCKRFEENNNDSKVEFETGLHTFRDSPQWESSRKKVSMYLSDFLKTYNSGKENVCEDTWATFGYKNMSDIPFECREGINFGFFGFPEIDEEISFWLGSLGAHTPCHYDTYGCNIVVQVYGRKLWLLFPPGTNLDAVRVPYEESSVYSSRSFYSPKNLSQFTDIADSCYKCILDPGDVLIVPKGWWHYVENLSVALSINTWLHLDVDLDDQMNEGITRFIVQKFVQSSSNDERNHILNPNEVLNSIDEVDLLNILECLSKEKLQTNKSKRIKMDKYKYQYLQIEQVLEKLRMLQDFVKAIEKMSSDEFYDLMRSNGKRFKADKNQLKIKERFTSVKEVLINSICDPSVIRNIKKLFLEKFEKEFKDELEST